ncbi:MAG: ABC transporter substrate-binding protein [Fusobacteriaceae bacterium]|jgi:peptide/nickel transport system substrate-binding protein|nr:ABC transporter substrate-binding protein [Fusobacteriaceae bacterium]
MKKILKSVLFTFVLLFSFSVALFSKATPDMLVIAQQADPKTLDPAATIDVYSHNVNLQIYDRLFDWGDGMKLENSLAERYEQKDPVTLYIKLREGVKFHNGEELTAEDVKFSLERASKAPSALTYFASIDRVDILSKYEVNIVTSKPYGPLINSLAHACGSILNKKYIESGDPNMFFEPIGTGPFKYESWKAGDKFILKTNKEYFNGVPEFEGIIFRVIPESTNRVIALETREIDMVLNIDPIDAQIIEASGHLKLITKPSVALLYVGMNCEKGPTADVRVRQAIVLATNTLDIVDNAFQKRSTPAYSVIPQGVLGYEELPPYETNIEKAKKLMAEAGYADGLKLKYWTNETQTRKDSGIIMQEQLKAIGIDLTIEILEWSAYLDKLSKAEHDIYMLGWPGGADPDGCLYPLFHSNNKGSAGNMSFYSNPRVDELLDTGRSSVDPAVREAAYKEAAKIIRDEVGVFAIVVPTSMLGTQDYISGFFAYPTSMHFFRKVKKNIK